MSTQKVAEFVDNLVADWPRFWPSRYEASHCIAATGIACVEAKRVGVDAEPMAVDAMFLNRIALGLVARKIPHTQWPDMAWSVGSNHDDPRPDSRGIRGGYPGHVVTIVDGRWLVDLSVQQYHRPQHGILLPAPLVVDIDGLDRHSDQGVIVELARKAEAQYVLRPGEQGWRRSPNWSQRREAADEFRAWREQS